MLHAKVQSLLAWLTVALAMAFSAGCLLAPFAGASRSWLLGSLGLALTVVGTACAICLLQTSRANRSAKAYLEALMRVDYHDFADGVPHEALPALGDATDWQAPFQRLRDLLGELALQLQNEESERTALDLKIRRSEARAQRVAQVLAEFNEPILAVDRYNEIVLANDSAAKLFDAAGDDIEHKLLAEVVQCQQLVEMFQDVRRRNSNQGRRSEIALANGAGGNVWYSVNARRLGDEEGVVAVLRDISSEKVEQRRHAEFVSAVSHEMKTPLAGIKAYVELLADGDADDEESREEFLAVINSQADRLQRLIDNMLNLARIEAGVTKVNKEQRSLNELLEEAVNVVQPSAERKRISLTTDLSPMYLGVFADRDTLLQAAINLLSNAIKYTPDGGAVVLRSRLNDDQVMFEVQDTGVGLSSEDAERVFEKFYRVKKDQQMASGTGLGLPLVKHIIEDVHSGRVEVRSQLGEGSTFAAFLPTSGRLS